MPSIQAVLDAFTDFRHLTYYIIIMGKVEVKIEIKNSDQFGTDAFLPILKLGSGSLV